MNSLVDISDSGQSPRGPVTPWSPVRVNRRRSDPSPVTPPSSDPTSQHAQLAVADNRVDATGTLPNSTIRRLGTPFPKKHGEHQLHCEVSICFCLQTFHIHVGLTRSCLHFLIPYKTVTYSRVSHPC